jgi:hypothetical protein
LAFQDAKDAQNNNTDATNHTAGPDAYSVFVVPPGGLLCECGSKLWYTAMYCAALIKPKMAFARHTMVTTWNMRGVVTLRRYARVYQKQNGTRLRNEIIAMASAVLLLLRNFVWSLPVNPDSPKLMLAHCSEEPTEVAPASVERFPVVGWCA